MSQSIVMLQVYPQPGLLLRLATTLSRYGLRVVGQKQEPPDTEGVSRLALTVNGERHVDGLGQLGHTIHQARHFLAKVAPDVVQRQGRVLDRIMQQPSRYQQRLMSRA